MLFFFFSSRRRHTRSKRDWSSDVCSSDLAQHPVAVSEQLTPELAGEAGEILDDGHWLPRNAPRANASAVLALRIQTRRGAETRRTGGGHLPPRSGSVCAGAHNTSP